MKRIARPCLFIFLLLGLPICVQAQTATYHLHNEASATSGLFQLRPVGPDAASVAVQSADLKNLATGEYRVKEFDTQAGVPNAAGVIPANSTVTLTVWMKKTANFGSIVPRVRLNLNSAAGSLLCTVTGSAALSTTLTQYTLTGATGPAAISVAATDRLYLWVGVNVTASVGNHSVTSELDLEGTLNGNYDSRLVIPVPVAVPIISNLSPAVGPVGASITVNGSNFGATQGTSIATFNGVTATPTSWTATSIVALVPSGATSGPVVITVSSVASNGVSFTVAQTGTVAGTVKRASDLTAITGALVEAVQSSTIKASTSTASDGTYVLPNLLVGTYDVRASAPGYNTQTQSGTSVTAGNTASVNFSLVGDTSIKYFYDKLGRLVGVVDPNSDTAVYAYDSVGNVLSVQRHNSAQISIIEFSPTAGTDGASVTIYGTGFSAAVSENTVQFNGAVGTILSSSPTQIVASVPTGATTGPIAVTSVAGSALSGKVFTVGSSAGTPMISSFTPPIATPGSPVVVSGTGFQTTRSNNVVRFNIGSSEVLASSASNLTTSAPLGVGSSGRISVVTSSGKATSTGDFFVVPPPYGVSDIEVTGRMAIGESKTVSINTANKIGIILFDGTAGQHLALRVTSESFQNCCYFNIYYPNERNVAGENYFDGLQTLSNAGLADLVLPVTATYAIVIDPFEVDTGSVTFSLNVIPADVTGTIIPGGPSVTLTTTAPGQNMSLTFSGNAGQRVYLDENISCCFNIFLYRPDGHWIPPQWWDGYMNTQTLPVSGTYRILIDVPPGAVTPYALTSTLYDVPPDATNNILPGGAPVTQTISVPGQNARLTFNGTTGQRVSFRLLGIGACGLYLYGPNGDLVAPGSTGSDGGFINAQVLSVTGTYTIFIDPNRTYTGMITSTLYQVPPDPSGTIIIGGPSVTATTTTLGQNASLTFNGNAGQRVSLYMSNVMTSLTAYISILDPNGQPITSPPLIGATLPDAFVEPFTLPTTGTYTINIDFNAYDTGSITFAIYNVPADVSGSIILGGATVNVTTTAPGQNALLTFSGTTGQSVTVKLTGNTIGSVTVSLVSPSGSTLTFATSSSNRFNLATQTIAASGTYSIKVDPVKANTGSITVALTGH